MQAMLSRGHTVDKLSEEELQSIVESIDKVRAQRNDQAGPAAQQLQPQQKNDDKARSKGAAAQQLQPQQNDDKARSEGAAQQLQPQHKNDDKARSEGAANVDKAAANANKDAAEEKSGKETKLERKKRLHARNMRYYRSFASLILSASMY